MRHWFDVLVQDGTDILFGLALLLIVYLIARLLRASVMAAAVIALLPLVLALLVGTHTGPDAMLAMLR